MRYIFNILLLTFCFSTASQAQVSILSGVINKYSRVSKLDTCAVTATVYDPNYFTVGSKVLLIQTNGATMQEKNNEGFGTLESLKNSGKYEINEVDSIIGNVVFLKYRLQNVYNDLFGVLQLVTFPKYDNAVVNDTLRAKPWDGQTGGIIAFEANTITLNAPISASGAGFRGGITKSYSQCESFDTYSDYYFALNSTTVNSGGQKGESVVPYSANKECGRGPQVHGGGGGNNHKSGGGGGANMSAGGSGGESQRSNILRCPGKYPGLGGISLPNNSSGNALFFGGGGGAGHNKEGTGNSNGGNGGGIVIIKANSLEGNNRVIAANGVSALFIDGDGAGGGGAGGTIALAIPKITGELTLEAKGGNGGNTGSTNSYDFGPGGGGSGGRIVLSTTTSSVKTILTGGGSGRNITTSSSQGATSGTIGISAVSNTFSLPNSTTPVIRQLTISKQPIPILVCEGDATSLTVVANGPGLKYQWEINKGTGYTPLSNDDLYQDVTTNILKIAKATTDLSPYLYRCALTSNCLTGPGSTLPTNDISLIIRSVPIPIFSYVIKNNKVEFTNGSSNGVSFKWLFGDGGTDTMRSPVHTYAEQDTYRVVLTVINECGNAPYSTTINLNTQPFASFTANGIDACPPTSITFTNTSSNNVRKFFWSFPGGKPDTSTERNPLIEYNKTGLHDVRLIVENGFGRDTFFKKQYVRINGKPIIDFSATKNGLNVNFLNNTTSATNYLWKFGDGNTSAQLSPVYTYRFAGTYIVYLTATNSCGSVTDSIILPVFALPAATIDASQVKGCSPLAVQFAGRNTTSVSTWNWSFPGGIPATSNQANPKVTYNQPGTYDVILTMTNAVGTNTVKQDTFIKVSVAPKVSFNYILKDNVLEVVNNSLDADKYTWNYGDGVIFEGANPPPHVYNRNGLYTLVVLGENKFCSTATEKQLSISFFTASKEVDTEGGIKTYPNPTNGRLYIEFKENTKTDFKLHIANTHGKVLKNTQLSKETVQELDINDLSDGVYFLHFSSENQRFVKKIVKMK